MSELLNRRKLTKAKELLKASHIYLHLDARKDSVVVPADLKKQPGLTLVISLNFNGQVDINNDRVVADLLFNGAYFKCQIPWDAVWGMSTESGTRTVWEESLPKTPSEENRIEQSSEDRPPQTTPKPAGKPHLTRVK